MIVTEQTHGKMESICFMQEGDKLCQILFISVEGRLNSALPTFDKHGNLSSKQIEANFHWLLCEAKYFDCFRETHSCQTVLERTPLKRKEH